MKLAQFENYLREACEYKESTIGARIKNCERLAAFEGNLDARFHEDCMEDLLTRLTYSTKDERLGLPKKHRVPINGNTRTGTATLKSAATLYREFRYGGRPPRSRARKAGWPDWQQPAEADILKLAHVLTPLVKFLHPDIVAAVVENNQHNLSDWRLKLGEVDIDPNIYLWNGSPCAFPGVRRYTNKERPSFKDRKMNFPHCLFLDDNDYPKHLWAYALTGRKFEKKGPRGFQLAHLADHQKSGNRWCHEFDLDSQAAPPPLFGLFTSPANTAFVPQKFLRPTDAVRHLRALLLKQAYRLYGRVCRLAPPPLTEKALHPSAWDPEHFTWSDPVGDVRKVAPFLAFRNEEINKALSARFTNAPATT